MNVQWALLIPFSVAQLLLSNTSLSESSTFQQAIYAQHVTNDIGERPSPSEDVDSNSTVLQGSSCEFKLHNSSDTQRVRYRLNDNKLRRLKPLETQPIELDIDCSEVELVYDRTTREKFRAVSLERVDRDNMYVFGITGQNISIQ